MLLVVVVAVGYCVSRESTNGLPEPADAWRSKDESADADIMIEDFVKQRLVSPGSAQFPEVSADHIKNLGNQRYSIKSWVDSQNTFGGLMRTHFSGVIEQVEKGRWKLVSLDMR